MPYYNRDPKKDHNFDSHPYGSTTGFPLRAPDLGAVACVLPLLLGFWVWGLGLGFRNGGFWGLGYNWESVGHAS